MRSSIAKPLICITCGPAYEPLDHVRRITNFSTGEIGTILSLTFSQRGFDVICFRGEGSTYPAAASADVRVFSTNASLAEGLQKLEAHPALILHAAALCDFFVTEIKGATATKKLDSRSGPIQLTLRPAEKLLPYLRKWFPRTLIVGWKYELEGSRQEAIHRAKSQIQKARTDACVVNGAAFGEGFGFLLADNSLKITPSKASLAEILATWAEERLQIFG